MRNMANQIFFNVFTAILINLFRKKGDFLCYFAPTLFENFIHDTKL